VNKLVLKDIQIIKANILLHYSQTDIIKIIVEEEPSLLGQMSVSSQYTTTLYEGTNEYKICKELIDTENKTLALLNINHKSIGIAVVARKILSI
jgi:hypothetical protein